MAHFAELDHDLRVVRVLVVPDEYEGDDRGQRYLAFELGLGGLWVQTSYNGRIRAKYAAIGDYYDPDLDEFVSPPE